MSHLLIDLTPAEIRLALVEPRALDVPHGRAILQGLVIHKNSAVKNIASKTTPGPAGQSRVGQVIVGRIRTIMPGNFAFIDIGTGKNAFANFKKGHLHKAGQPLLVQVQKDAQGKKGPYVTEDIALKGWLVILHKHPPGEVGVSHKIEDETEARRLKKLVRKQLPKGYGAIVRTNGAHATAQALAEEINTLAAQYQDIVDKSPFALPPAVLHPKNAPPAENEILPDLQSLLSDMLTAAVEAVYIHITGAPEDPQESKLLFAGISSYISGQFPALAGSIYPHGAHFLDGNLSFPSFPPSFPTEEGPSLFKAHGIHKQIKQALEKEVPLPSGGFITIEETEACVVIDVNTGNTAAGYHYGDTVLATNLEAAGLAIDQIILRNLSGIIIIDFIDMESKTHEAQLMAALKTAAKKDRLNPLILDITPLGLVQMARPKRRLSLSKILQQNCPHCGGSGLLRL